MAEQTGEKTEQPTPKKERDARQKGQVARSQEVVTTVSLFGVLVVIYLLGNSIWVRLTALMDTVALLAQDLGPQTLNTALAATWQDGVAIMMPILGATLFFGIAANYIQVGTLFSFDAITPKLEKISINKGFKRIFSMKQVVELLKSIFKIVFLTLLLIIVLRDALGPYIISVDCGLFCVRQVTTSIFEQLLAFSFLAFIVVSGFDYVYQRHTHTKSLMMTKDEVKREYKESEGDPVVKGHRRQFAHELVMGDVKKQTRNASAVVVNPTHLAVAIRYKEGQTPLPMIVAKGRNHQAYEMRKEAELSGVPIFRNVPLARLLFAEADSNDYVPDEVFDVIAEILAWIARNEADLYKGPSRRGDIDMERGDHRADADRGAA